MSSESGGHGQFGEAEGIADVGLLGIVQCTEKPETIV
jgi:hypothetical protein